jgi:Zn-finger nucleic acid-binding protein
MVNQKYSIEKTCPCCGAGMRGIAFGDDEMGCCPQCAKETGLDR